MLGQLSRQKKTDSCLDLSAGDGRPSVVVSQTGSFSSDALKNIIHKAVHDIHGFAGNSSIRVDLLQDLVDVDRVGFPPPPAAFLVPSSLGLGLGGGFLGSLGSCCFGRHRDSTSLTWVNRVQPTVAMNKVLTANKLLYEAYANEGILGDRKCVTFTLAAQLAWHGVQAFVLDTDVWRQSVCVLDLCVEVNCRPGSHLASI